MPKVESGSSYHLETILVSEVILVFVMALKIVPQEFSYLILVLLVVSFIRLSILDSLKLFIFSIPFFVAFPSNAISDSMSIWRVLVVVLFLKVIYEKYSSLIPVFSTGSFLESQNETSLVQSQKTPDKLQFMLSLPKAAGKARLIRAIFQLFLPKKLIGFAVGGKGRRFQSFVSNNSWKGTLRSDLSNLKKARYCKLFCLAMLFFAISILSLFFAQSVGAGIKKILFLVNVFLLFPIVVYAVKREDDIAEVLRAVFYSSLLIVLIGYFQFFLTFFISLYDFWQFWARNVVRAFYGQNLSNLLSYSNTWFSYYKFLPPTLRMFSVMPDSHSFAMLVLASVPVVLSLFFHSKKSEKKLLSAALIFFLLAVFFSGSRGAWVGSVFALLAAMYLYYHKPLSFFWEGRSAVGWILSCAKVLVLEQWQKLRKTLVLLKISVLRPSHLSREQNNKEIKDSSSYFSKLIICSVVLFFILMPVSSFMLRQNQEIQLSRSGTGVASKEESAILERAISISDFSETSNKGRLQIWRETLVSIKNNPFLGVGFGNFPVVLGEDISAFKKGSSAHNVYLDIAAELGIFGLMIFLLLLADILETSYALFYKLEAGYLKVFAGSFFVYFVWILAYSFFDVVIFNDKVLMVIVIMIALIYSLEEYERDYQLKKSFSE